MFKNVVKTLVVVAAFAGWLCCGGCVKAEDAKTITNSIGMKLVLIPKGKLTKNSETTGFIVPFYMGVHEVTQEQYYKVMGGNPSRFVGEKVAERDPFTNRVVNEGDSRFHPVENLNYNNAIEFCQKLSALPSERAAGRVYRLPSEEEWEYACRAGTTTTYSFGDSAVSLGDYAWYEANSNGRTHPVGQKKPNAWGLYDMHGNVSEWCIDEIDHPFALAGDPRLSLNRGGSLYSDPRESQPTSRRISAPSVRHDPYNDIGFRIVWDFQRDVRVAELKKREQEKKAEEMAKVAEFNRTIEAINAKRTVVNSIGMKLRKIEVPSFPMIAKPYYIGVYEVTQAQYEELMGKNPSKFKGSQNPVEQVSWDDAVQFCQRLSELPEERSAGRVYRLPTEAEWEDACRAGSKTKYGFSGHESDLDGFAYFSSNSGGQTHPVGQKRANDWGLYDMHGNVWEWCSDDYDDYPRGSATDPTGRESFATRVIRGGSWGSEAARCRSASRHWSYRVFGSDRLGFRVALSSFGIPK